MVQSVGLYQLENLLRQQAKFVMIALTDDIAKVPIHPLLKIELSAVGAQAPAKIQALIQERSLPNWWPVVLVSEDGVGDEAVAVELAARGLINVFSYKGGWSNLIAETAST